MDFIKFNSVRIAFSVKGTGFPIVWLHGFGGDSSVWDEYIAPFSQYQHILIDLPGLGQSSVMVDSSVEKFADIIFQVLQNLDIKECILIGHSMGGYVSLAFAKKYPDLLKGLVLFHSQPFADSKEKKANRLKSINFVKRNGTLPYVKQLKPLLFSKKYKKENPSIIKELILKASAYSPDGIMQCLQLMHDRSDNTATLANSKCPVCFIVGTEDLAIPEKNSFQQLYLPPIADIHILEGVNHMGMFESTIETQKILQSFLHTFDL